MALTIAEFFGYAPNDRTSSRYVRALKCPFLPGDDSGDLKSYGQCIKPKHGACSLSQTNADAPVIACPNRLYDDGFRVLKDVAAIAFGSDKKLVSKAQVDELKAKGELKGNEVAVFGKGWGSELSIPQNTNAETESTGGFFIDYVLARLDRAGEIVEFTAVEIQTIDTSGSYLEQASLLFKRHGAEPAPDAAVDIDDLSDIPQGVSSKAGFNWANVSKRILPQLIYKGYVLRREQLCSKGLFFICPAAVLKRVKARLGTKLLDYPIAAGTITFLAYDLGENGPRLGQRRSLVQNAAETLTTTVEQIAYAFVSPVNLPEMGVYQKAINAALKKAAPHARSGRG